MLQIICAKHHINLHDNEDLYQGWQSEELNTTSDFNRINKIFADSRLIRAISKYFTDFGYGVLVKKLDLASPDIIPQLRLLFYSM